MIQLEKLQKDARHLVDSMTEWTHGNDREDNTAVFKRLGVEHRRGGGCGREPTRSSSMAVGEQARRNAGQPAALAGVEDKGAAAMEGGGQDRCEQVAAGLSFTRAASG